FASSQMEEQTAVQIVEKVGKYYVLTNALNQIIQQNKLENKKVAVLTVAGAFRKGKSFFLSNIVRYLQCNQSGKDWMAPNSTVSGFTWRQSKKAVTEGILMWPEPFSVKNARGEEIVILLMDTEGAFDHKSSMTQCATVFALSALLSSMLVYNVSQDVQEDTLNHLQFFASYGSYALDNSEGTSPFQSLLFLIRDWQNDNEYGFEAGRRHLDDMMKAQASSNPSMQHLRRDIQRSFVDIKCALLPYPGEKISRGSEGAITVNDMKPDFREQLGSLVPYLIGNLLRSKEIGGKQINGNEFLQFFDSYIKIFASGVVPEPKSVFDATAEATHQSAMAASLGHYETSMKAKFAELNDRQYFEDANLKTIHEEILNDSVRMFTELKKMGSLTKYFDLLKDEIKVKFEGVYLKDNLNIKKMELTRREKEEAERLMVEQEHRAKEEHERQEKEKEELRIKMEKEVREKEEVERRRSEEERRHGEEMDAAERRRIEEQTRASEEKQRMEEELRRQADEGNAKLQGLESKMEQMAEQQLEDAKRAEERHREDLRMMNGNNGGGGGGVFGALGAAADSLIGTFTGISRLF
ncbi:hypothetical protein PMAYCL1PPCAC_25634, partial [Pristionchus mayeri]